MTLHNFAILLAGFAIGYVVGSFIYSYNSKRNKYKVNEITSADIARIVGRIK